MLGFQTRHFEGFASGMAVRGETELHFSACNHKHVAENTSCYIRVADIAAVHAELRAKRPVAGPPPVTNTGPMSIMN